MRHNKRKAWSAGRGRSIEARSAANPSTMWPYLSCRWPADRLARHIGPDYVPGHARKDTWCPPDRPVPQLNRCFQVLKVRQSCLRLIKHHVMKSYRRVDTHHHFDLGTRWTWMVSFAPRQLYPPPKSFSGTHWIGILVGPVSRYGRCGVETISYLRRESNPSNRPWRPIGLWDVEDPTLSRQSVHS
jgi:hypothetical protein